jgi:DnaJ-domain-containing protein 1
VTEPNPFELLGLATRFAIDRTDLERRQREAFLRRGHSAEPSLELERVNDAVRILKDPLSRAELLFHLRGWSTKSAPNPELLERAFRERDAIESAQADGNDARLMELVGSARQRRDALVASLAALLDAEVPSKPTIEAEAAAILDDLRYLSRALAAAEAALEALDERSDP